MSGLFKKLKFKINGTSACASAGVFRKKDIYLGQHVTVYPKVTLGSGSVVLDGAVLGRVPMANKTMSRKVKSQFSPLFFGN